MANYPILSDDDIKTMMGNMEDVLKRKESLDPEIRKILDAESVVKELQEVTKGLDERYTPEVAEQAVKLYLKQMFAFPPQKESTLAQIYVRRGKYKKPVAAIAIAASLATGSTVIGNTLYHKAGEHHVEDAVETSFLKKSELERRVHEMTGSPLAKAMPDTERSDLTNVVGTSSTRLKSLDSFFSTYCANGDADDEVTAENYSSIEEKLTPVASVLAEVENTVGHGEALLVTEKKYADTRASLDAKYKAIKEAPLFTAPFLTRADTAYKRGLSSLGARNLSDAEKALGDLQNVSNDFTKFMALSPEPERLYKDIKGVAKIDVKEADTLYADAKRYIDNADVKSLESIIGKLKSLDAILKEEYTLTVMGGKWRYPNDNHSAHNFYLIVEARTASGAPTYKEIKSEEDGRVENVYTWGERVPEAEYEKVKADKTDDGIIQNNLFGEKKSGYKDLEYHFDHLGGKITHW